MTKTIEKTIHSDAKQEKVLIEFVDVGNRFRNNLGDIDSLKASIEEVGLIHPISVLNKSLYRKAGMGELEDHALDPDKPFLLLAGERRFRAWCALLEEGKIAGNMIEAKIHSTLLSTDDLRVIELVENGERKDMEWHERDELISEIHKIRTRKKGISLPGRGGGEGHTMTDTADLLNISTAQVSRAIKRHESMDRVPEMALAGSASEADKIMEGKIRQLAIEELNRRRTARMGEDEDVIKKMLIDNYIIGDALEGLRSLDDNTVDFFEIDPPYGTDYPDLVKDYSAVLNYKETKDFPSLINTVMPEVARVLKDDRWGILWFGIQHYQVTLEAILAAGLQVNTTPLLWEKPNGSTNNPKYIMPSGYETAFYFRKGLAELRSVPGKNIFLYNRVPEKYRIHPTERPMAMIQELLKYFVAEGATVVSPFLGSGATILACHNANMQCMGWDLSEEYKERHIHRILSQTGPKFLAAPVVEATADNSMAVALAELRKK